MSSRSAAAGGRVHVGELPAHLGYLIGGGPFADQDDERLRGISVMTVDPETARELCSADPAVRAGRLAVQVMTWIVPAGSVTFHDVRAPRSMAEAEAGDD